MANGNGTKPRLAVFKFASCDGCQLALISLEDELVPLANEVEIAYFLEARTQALEGPYDIGLVEGSVTTPHDAKRIREIREQCKFLMTIGACATSGGIQALRNWASADQYARLIYASPQFIDALNTSTPISAHVAVDFELNGCPVNKYQLLEVLTGLLLGRMPRLPAHSVCMECKRRGTVCVTVAQGIPCLGPLTHAGCGAICPAFNRGCYGCFGPMESPNPDSLVSHLKESGVAAADMVRLLRGFAGYADAFRDASDRWEKRT